MNIGFDAKRAFLNSTGLGFYSRMAILALANNYPNCRYILFGPSNNSKYLSVFKRFEIIGPKFKFPPFQSYWRVLGVSRSVNNSGIQIFHGLSNELPLGLSSKIKTVVTIHDIIPIVYPRYYNLIQALIYKAKFKFSINYADKIIAVSQKTANDIIENFNINPEKITVIYQDCDSRFKQIYDEIAINEIKQKYELIKPYVLCVGTIEERKNQLKLVKAFEKLNNTTIELVLVGNMKSNYAKEVLNYINKSKSPVKILNYVDHNDLPMLYQGALAFAYPSVYEGFGIPVLEAVYSKVPILTSKDTSMQEITGEYGAVYVNPIEIDSIEEGLRKIINSKQLRTEITNFATKRTHLFEEKTIADKLMNVYKLLTIEN